MDIDNRNTIEDLKDAMKKKTKNIVTYDAYELRLYHQEEWKMDCLHVYLRIEHSGTWRYIAC